MKYTGLYQWSYAVVALVGAVGFYLAFDFSRDGRYLPLLAGAATFVCATVLFVSERRRVSRLRAGAEDAGRGPGGLEGAAVEEIPIRGILTYGGIVLAYIAGLFVLGALVTTGLFVGVLLIVDGGTTKWTGIVGAVTAVVALIGLHYAIGLEYPTGLIFDWVVG